MSLKEILVLICEIGNRKPPKISIPHNLILPIAKLIEIWAGFTGVEPLTTVDGIKMAKKHMFFSSRKAKEKLAYQSRPAKQAISDAIDWFVANALGLDPVLGGQVLSEKSVLLGLATER